MPLCCTAWSDGIRPVIKGGAIGHAHRIGDVKPVEAGPARGQPVDMRRAQNRIAIASQMIGPVLIGDDKNEIGAFGHYVRRCRLRLSIKTLHQTYESRSIY